MFNSRKIIRRIFHSNFELSGTLELTVFELTVPDLYTNCYTISGNYLQSGTVNSVRTDDWTSRMSDSY